MENKNGTGVVRKVGDKELKVVKDAKGNPTAESEGFFTYEYPQLAGFEEVVSFYEQRDEKGIPVNTSFVTDENGKRTYLTAEQTITVLVNNELERAAKANAYQKTVAKFKPAEDPKAAFEKIVRTFMSLGLPEEFATMKAKETIAENEARVAAAEAAAASAG